MGTVITSIGKVNKNGEQTVTVVTNKHAVVAQTHVERTLDKRVVHTHKGRCGVIIFTVTAE